MIWCQQSAFIISSVLASTLKFIFHSKFWCSASMNDMSFYRYFWYLKTAILGPWEVLEVCPFSLLRTLYSLCLCRQFILWDMWTSVSCSAKASSKSWLKRYVDIVKSRRSCSALTCWVHCSWPRCNVSGVSPSMIGMIQDDHPVVINQAAWSCCL